MQDINIKYILYWDLVSSATNMIELFKNAFTFVAFMKLLRFQSIKIELSMKFFKIL